MWALFRNSSVTVAVGDADHDGKTDVSLTLTVGGVALPSLTVNLDDNGVEGVVGMLGDVVGSLFRAKRKGAAKP